MCGIAGWINYNNSMEEKSAITAAMINTLKHRGPDSEGIWISPHAALGHRRLAVVDVERGLQPMVRQKNDTRYIISYNGELYNTEDIRKELVLLGYSFSTSSDTEVLLYSYIQWGESCLERLNGIFAFAIWNDSTKSLFLVRDRFGVKPLFYSTGSFGLVFASELKSLLQHPEINPLIGKEGLSEIFALSPARTPGHGIYQGIHELKPGKFIHYTIDGFIEKEYWRLKGLPHKDSGFETIGKIRYLVTDSIQRQLVSDVPVCTFLSGGLDSGIITAIAANQYKQKNYGSLTTYSVNYTDNEKFFKESVFQPNSDKQYIDKMSSIFKTHHNEILVDNKMLADSLIDAAEARDLPGMADIDSSLWHFCKEVKANSTVALSGECADEFFGGYPWFHREELLNSNTFPWMIDVDEKLGILSDDLVKAISPKEYIQFRYEEAKAQTPYLEGETELEKKRREVFYLNITWFMANLLERKDRMSMAHGLEVRVPFCDHRLAQYIFNVPWQLKMYNDREKGLLRKSVVGLLPDDILWRKKSPYPKTHHPIYEETVKGMLREILSDGNSPIIPYVNREKLLGMLDEPSDYGKPWFGQLMARPQLFAYLIQVNHWLKKYKVAVSV